MRKRSVREAVDQLSKVSPQDGPRAVLDALTRCVPVAGGTIGTMLIHDSAQSLTSHAVHLPAEMFDSWMSTPPRDFARMMAPLVHGPVGGLFNDRRAITGELRERLDVIRSVRAAGLGETAGFKVASHETTSGALEIVFMTLALDSGATFRPEHSETLALLLPSIEAALGRLRVPVLSSKSIIANILDDRTIGFACISGKGRIVEANDRAYALALRYADPTRTAVARCALKDLAMDLLHDAKRAPRTCRFRGPGSGFLDVETLWLAKEAYGVSENLTLLVIREGSASVLFDGLTERQHVVALQLVQTERSYKQIANALGISEGTMRKHVENIYRRLGVQSRPELTVRWNKLGSS
jgi:DNA-binding CsgD family transcriptional regulator